MMMPIAVCALFSVLAPHPVSGYSHGARAGLLMGPTARHLPARAQPRFVSHIHKGSQRAARLRCVVERLHPSLAYCFSLTESQPPSHCHRRASQPHIPHDGNFRAYSLENFADAHRRPI